MEQNQLFERMATQPDDVLVRIVSEKASDYTAAAVAAARLEIAKRGITIPAEAQTVKDAGVQTAVDNALSERASVRSGWYYVRLSAEQQPSFPRKCACCGTSTVLPGGFAIGAIANCAVQVPVCRECKRHWRKLRVRRQLLAPFGTVILLVGFGAAMQQKPAVNDMSTLAIISSVVLLFLPLALIIAAIAFFTRPAVRGTGHAPRDREPAEMRVTPKSADYCFSREDYAVAFARTNGLTHEELRAFATDANASSSQPA
jgi:hypothetical protein